MNSFTKPEVTIITVTKNRADLLKRAIKSVLAQTFRNFEYIIVDGASTDHTSEVVESFQDKRIKYHKLKEDFNPMVLCHEYAIKLSLGEFITFLDDDDEYLPSKIEKQYNLMKSLPEEYGMIYCWMNYYDQVSGKLIEENHHTNRGYVFYECIEKQSMGGTPTLFLRKEVYYDVNGFNKNLKYSSDWEFNTRVARKYLIDFVPEVLVKVYVNHPYLRMTQDSNIKNRNKVNNLIEFYEYFLTEFNDGFQKYPEKKITHLVRLAKFHSRLGDSVKSKKIISSIIKEFGFSTTILVTAIKCLYFLKFENLK